MHPQRRTDEHSRRCISTDSCGRDEIDRDGMTNDPVPREVENLVETLRSLNFEEASLALIERETGT